MKLATGFCLIAVLGAGVTLQAQAGPIARIQAPPPGPNAQTPSTQSATADSAQTPVRVSGGAMEGLLIKKVQPEHPSDADAEGTVVLHAIIGADGKVQQLAVVSGPADLQPLAENAVRQWEYKPYMKNGRPTPVDTTIVINFRR